MEQPESQKETSDRKPSQDTEQGKDFFHKQEQDFQRDNSNKETTRAKPSYRHKRLMGTKHVRSKAATSKVVKVLSKTTQAATKSSREKLKKEVSECFKLTEKSFELNSESVEHWGKALKLPKEQEKSKFLDTRYAHQLTAETMEVAERMVNNLDYYHQMKKMNWAIRVFFNVEEPENLEEVDTSDEEDWIYDPKAGSYCNKDEEKDAAELQNEVTLALNEALLRESREAQNDKANSNHNTKVTFYLNESKNGKERFGAPFSTAFLCSNTQTMHIEVELKDGIKLEPIVFTLLPKPGLIRWSCRVSKPVLMEEGREIMLNYNYGFDCVSKGDDFSQKLNIWNDLAQSQKKQETYIRQYPVDYRRLHEASMKMAQFLNTFESEKLNVGLGAIAVDLLKGVSVKEMNFEKNYDDGLARLRYITLEEGNREAILDIFKTLSQQNSLSKRMGEVERNGHKTPYSFSKPAKDDTKIDFFISHSWMDDAEERFNKLVELSDDFFAKEGRLPKLWIDMFCIDQSQQSVGVCVKLLPLFLMACDKMVVLLSSNLVTRLWCLTELLARYLLGDYNDKFFSDIIMMPVDKCSDFTIDIAKASCHHADDEEELRKILKEIPSLNIEIIEGMIGEIFEKLHEGNLSV